MNRNGALTLKTPARVIGMGLAAVLLASSMLVAPAAALADDEGIELVSAQEIADAYDAILSSWESAEEAEESTDPYLGEAVSIEDGDRQETDGVIPAV